jgi:hypothetical protein
MKKGITNNEIEQIVDENLRTMFNPLTKVPTETKSEIRHETLKLSHFFIDIIKEYNLEPHSDDFVDRVIDKVELFVTAYEKLLNVLPKKIIAVSVGQIWYSFFVNIQNELKDNISDKMLFEYGENKIQPILMLRLRN